MVAETNPKSLTPHDVASLGRDGESALLAYLNLPPVGGIDDAHSVPETGSATMFELSKELRDSIRSRRDNVGRFRSREELVGIPGLGVKELRAIRDRLDSSERYGNRARLFWGGPESLQELFALLDKAERYIHVSAYIVGGDVGLRMMRLLALKQRQGVRVRVLFCASGLVISGSPSGTGFVSRWSEWRSYLLNDFYQRRRMLREMEDAGIPFVDSSPVGRHWRRRTFRALGVRSRQDYERWARRNGIPDVWLDEQERVNAECGLPFINVNHRKMVIVDGVSAFVGSQNIADSYLYSNELSDDPRVNIRRWQWHDGSVIVQGPCVRELGRLFARRWALSGGDRFEPDDSFYSPSHNRRGHAVVTIHSSIPGQARLSRLRNLPGLGLSLLGGDGRPRLEGRNPIRDRVVAMPDLSRTDFYAEHCYPSDPELLTKWASSAARLSELHMVVPLHYDTPVLGTECNRYYPELISAGVQLWGYERAILHSKIIVVDGWYVSTGSYNLTLRSGRADLEVQFFIQCPELGSEVRDRIRSDRVDCRRVTPGLWARLRSRHSVPLFDGLVRYFLL